MESVWKLVLKDLNDMSIQIKNGCNIVGQMYGNANSIAKIFNNLQNDRRTSPFTGRLDPQFPQDSVFNKFRHNCSDGRSIDIKLSGQIDAAYTFGLMGDLEDPRDVFLFLILLITRIPLLYLYR